MQQQKTHRLETQLPTLPQALREVVLDSDPAKTDRVLGESLTSLLGSKPKAVWSDKTTTHGWDGDLVGYKLPAMTEEKRTQALHLVDQSLMPMTQSECFGLLGELKLTTMSRADQGHDLEAQLKIYARKLQEFPADVVRHVLTSQSSHSKWWPTWAELKDRLDFGLRRRLKLKEALTKSSITSPT